MAKRDQTMRTKAMSDMSLWDESLDKKHTEALKRIIKQYGWPTIALVGQEASNDAWLIVQHADHDPKFQEQCLGLIKSLPKQEVTLSNVAYLEDRVRVAQGQPQLYGTQFDQPGENFGPKVVEDWDRLDTRRSAMGLQPFEEYRKLMIEYNKSGFRGTL